MAAIDLLKAVDATVSSALISLFACRVVTHLYLFVLLRWWSARALWSSRCWAVTRSCKPSTPKSRFEIYVHYTWYNVLMSKL